MRKIFTFAAALLLSMGMFADIILTLPTDATEYKRGYSYVFPVTGSDAFLDDAQVYFTSYDGKIDGGKINPYRSAFVFKSKAAFSLALSFSSTTTSKRTNTAIVYEVNEKLFEVYKGVGEGWLAEQIRNNASDEDLNGIWKEAGVTKLSGGKIIFSGDTAKILSGFSPKDQLLTKVFEHKTDVAGKEENKLDTLKKDGSDFLFESGKAYLIFSNVSSSSGLVVNALDIVPTCEAPATPLKLEVSKAEVEPDEEVTFTISGGNGAEVTLIGKNGETITDKKWKATGAGTHTFEVSQPLKDGKCGATVWEIVKVLSTEKVTTAVIDGNVTGDKAFVGVEKMLYCVANNDATNYQWYENDKKIDGANEFYYSFTPTAEGKLVFKCEAWNKFNTAEDHAMSDPFEVNVAKEEVKCGEILRADHKDGTSATVTGVIGGVADKKTQSNGKLGSNNNYFGIKLAEGKFQKGDKLQIHATTVSEIVQIFSDKGETMINEGTFDANGIYLYKIMEETEWIYLYRTEEAGSKMNPFVDYMTVTRPCTEESSDATIKSISVNNEVIPAEGGVYPDEIKYEFPAHLSYDEVTVLVETNDPKAGADYKAKVLIPEMGESVEVKITITAEDGTQKVYKLILSREQGSDDATIFELTVDTKIVVAKNDTFAYEVPGDLEQDSVVIQYTTTDPYATSDTLYQFKMKIPEPLAAPTKKLITITADDKKTTKVYTVLISKAKKPEPEEAIENVQNGKVQGTKVLIDGRLVIIKNGIKYNAQGTIIE
jgi:hypothetical protein